LTRARIDVKVGDGKDLRLIETRPLTPGEVILLSPSAEYGVFFAVNGTPIWVLITPQGEDEPRRSTAEPV
jgi:hypothetical protein